MAWMEVKRANKMNRKNFRFFMLAIIFFFAQYFSILMQLQKVFCITITQFNFTILIRIWCTCVFFHFFRFSFSMEKCIHCYSNESLFFCIVERKNGKNSDEILESYRNKLRICCTRHCMCLVLVIDEHINYCLLFVYS